MDSVVSVERAAPRGVLRLGDRVRLDGEEHVVVGLSGTSVRLAGDDGTHQVLLATQHSIPAAARDLRRAAPDPQTSGIVCNA